ncbi:hypothetical protein ABB37_07537 [Leptomonas pyrrhocoris]|uniref:Uncharacterized protein n=1 Tax=Leptomonas pyrrhocoris TaxID=157538 RepID=A0A0M9FV34_LEPPY|nr:hypothetical protein ABB37_07537 [Leptomonas pyrrhocoris]KPA76690.1 hypothetical protein ABB37_07537 [Leptomonas pyrrhocoris]|eukprot:XP_015655129.1 hypothetical protein ABB37_07537 [Leptomonas pyrrhocoris]
MHSASSSVRFLERWPRAAVAKNRKVPCTSTTARHASTLPPTSKTALHSHTFLSAQEALQAAKSSFKSGAGSGGGAAGLTFTLPPLCVWGAALHSPSYSSEDGQGHAGRHSGLTTRGRYASIWSPIEAYLAQLSSSSLQSTRSAASTASPARPPVCASLRLFPDLTVAQLPTTFLQIPGAAGGADLVNDNVSPSKSPRGRRRPAAPHEQPLEAILAMEEPWGSGADAQQTFRHALEGLREVGQQLLPQVPLILQLPTRLLVTQQFLGDLASLLVRSGWRSVSFELPSTHQLYSPFQTCSSDIRCRGGGRRSSSSRSSEQRGGRGAERNAQVSSPLHDSGAVDAAWCRLPLLCTPWPVLCRHPTLGPSLRHLRRHDLVPFHVLFSWALTEAKLFEGLEKSLVVDVTAPMPGAERAQATRQSPSSVGISADEARQAFCRFKPASTLGGSISGIPAINTHGEEERAEEEEAEEAEAGNSPTPSYNARQHRVFMRENPMTSRGVGVGMSSGVVDAVRRHQGKESSEADRGGWTSSSSSSSKAVLTNAEAAWRRTKEAAPGHTTSHVRSLSEEAAPLLLDTPPDHLRALIEKSIAKQGTPDSPCALTPRQRLLQKVGQFMQHTLPHDAAAGTSGGSNAPPPSTSEMSGGDEELEREAAELEELLRQANDTAATSASVEDMMTEMQRCMYEHTPRDDVAVLPNASRSSDSTDTRQERNSGEVAPKAASLSEDNAWCSCSGYWACVRAILADLTHASLIWTLPTYNAAAVRAWTGAYTAAVRPTAENPGGVIMAIAAPLPPVVPVWMPLQPVMHTEVARLLREGHQFPQPPPNTTSVVAEEEECRTWLPNDLNTALRVALTQLPAEVQVRERRRLLRDYRLLRDEGAQGARRGGCVMQRAATTTAAGLPDAGDHRSSSSSVDGAEGSEHDSVADDDTRGEVRIRLRRRAYPFYLLAPSQVARMREEEERRRTTAATVSTTASTSNERTKASLAEVGKVNEAYMSKVVRYYRGAAVEQPSSLYVPTPGLDACSLLGSWQAIS